MDDFIKSVHTPLLYIVHFALLLCSWPLYFAGIHSFMHHSQLVFSQHFVGHIMQDLFPHQIHRTQIYMNAGFGFGLTVVNDILYSYNELEYPHIC